MRKNSIVLALVAAVGVCPSMVKADTFVSIGIAPPALPLYAQPPMPGDGYLWTPGYWAWSDFNGEYYWVPGTWVLAPFVGALWTPGYWGWSGGYYRWNGGYWGTHIGYYGGVNYGYGYVGVGYRGGYWNNGRFSYNRNVNNVGNVHGAHYYSETVPSSYNRVSYSGGQTGVRSQPTREESMIATMPHNAQTEPQNRHVTVSRGTDGQRVSYNHGMPAIAATPEPGKFNSPYVVASRPAGPSGSNSHPAVQRNPTHGSAHHR